MSDSAGCREEWRSASSPDENTSAVNYGAGGSDATAGQPKVLASFKQAHAPRGATGFEALVRFLLLFRGDDALTGVAPFTNPGPCDELSAAPAALFRHRFLQGEDARFLGQKMRIVEIAMIHVVHLLSLGDHSVPGSQILVLGVITQQRVRMLESPAPRGKELNATSCGIRPGCGSAIEACA